MTTQAQPAASPPHPSPTVAMRSSSSAAATAASAWPRASAAPCGRPTSPSSSRPTSTTTSRSGPSSAAASSPRSESEHREASVIPTGSDLDTRLCRRGSSGQEPPRPGERQDRRLRLPRCRAGHPARLGEDQGPHREPRQGRRLQQLLVRLCRQDLGVHQARSRAAMPSSRTRRRPSSAAAPPRRSPISPTTTSGRRASATRRPSSSRRRTPPSSRSRSTLTRSPEVAARKGIDVRFRHDLTEIRAGSKEAVFDHLDTGETIVQPYDMIHVTPPMSAPDFLKGSPLANADGWVDVDKATLQHVRFPNVFSLGDASSLPDLEDRRRHPQAGAGARAEPRWR